MMKKLFTRGGGIIFGAMTILAEPGLPVRAAVIPPMAAVKPVTLETHGHVRVDNYFWLRERENPEVIAYLEAENAFTQAMMAPTRELEEKLFLEIKGRIKEDDSTVPYRKDDYFYYTRFEAGKSYPIHCRKKGSREEPEEILLDLNELAKGHEFLNASIKVSPDHQWLAYGVDRVGRNFFDIHFRNLASGEEKPYPIRNVTRNMDWANDSRTLFYTRQHPETLRPYQVYRHTLGTDPAQDALVFEEKDETFWAHVAATKSRGYLLIGSRQILSSEFRFLDGNDPMGGFQLVHPRERGLEYWVDHLGDHFYIRTNEGQAANFKLARAPVSAPGKENWEEIIPHREEVFFQGFELFRDHLVLSERKEGLTHLRIRSLDGAWEHYLDFSEPAYVAGFGNNVELDKEVLRYTYTSLTTPDSVFDYNMVTREKTLLKEEPVLGGFDSNDYMTERLFAPARDGVEVPISLVYRRETPINGTAPLLLYGYGSYGASQEPHFNSARLSLLNRGFVFAIAHIRGGQELGRSWYEEGKLLKKQNTFTDFIDSAEFLVKKKFAHPDLLFAHGGSAGGLLMGAVINMRPDLWRGVVAEVPFVDVVTTMLDASIPLTTFEYDEWGNPNDPDYYDVMLSYSPYDNVRRKAYPHLLVTSGVHDSQVQYWEPAKWVARLRELKTDDNLLLLKTNMSAGHGGASARYERFGEIALNYTFLLRLANRECPGNQMIKTLAVP